MGRERGTMRETAASFLLAGSLARPQFDGRSVCAEHLRRGEPFDLGVPRARRSGAFSMVSHSRTGDARAGGETRADGGSLTDITERKQAEAQIFDEKERAQVTLASIADAVITVDMSGQDRVHESGGRAPDGLGRRTRARQHCCRSPSPCATRTPESRSPIRSPARCAKRCVVKSEGNVVLCRRDEAPVAIDYSVAPIRNRTASIVGAVLVFHDMSRERQYAARLSHLAKPRSAHRPAQSPRIRAPPAPDARDRSRAKPFNHAVLYLDLDQFKLVNDTCGHAAGDELLRQVTALLRPLLREGDTLARLGGDEFGVLLEHCPPEPAVRIAETMQRALAGFRFVWKTRSFIGSVSVGLVNVADGGQTLAGVLSAADAACYMAKDKGRNRRPGVQPGQQRNGRSARRDGMGQSRFSGRSRKTASACYAQPVCENARRPNRAPVHRAAAAAARRDRTS